MNSVRNLNVMVGMISVLKAENPQSYLTLSLLFLKVALQQTANTRSHTIQEKKFG